MCCSYRILTNPDMKHWIQFIIMKTLYLYEKRENLSKVTPVYSSLLTMDTDWSFGLKWFHVKGSLSHLQISLNITKTGGGGPIRPPPWHFVWLLCNAQSSRRITLGLFSFKFPAHFDTKFVTPRGTVLKLRNFLYMYARWTENGSKLRFWVQNQCKLEFFHIVHI